MGVGAQYGSILVILADDVIDETHALDIGVEIDVNRLGAHVCPLRTHIHLVMHNPVIDASISGALVAVCQVVDDGSIGIDALWSSHVGHRVVACAVFWMAKCLGGPGVRTGGSEEQDGTGDYSTFVTLLERVVVIGDAAHIYIIGLTAKFIFLRIAKLPWRCADDLIADHVDGDALYAQVVQIAQECVHEETSQPLLAFERHLAWTCLSLHFISIVRMRGQNGCLPAGIHNGPLGEQVEFFMER